MWKTHTKDKSRDWWYKYVEYSSPICYLDTLKARALMLFKQQPLKMNIFSNKTNFAFSPALSLAFCFVCFCVCVLEVWKKTKTKTKKPWQNPELKRTHISYPVYWHTSWCFEIQLSNYVKWCYVISTCHTMDYVNINSLIRRHNKQPLGMLHSWQTTTTTTKTPNPLHTGNSSAWSK